MAKTSSDREIADTLILNGERVSAADMTRFWRERPDPDFNAKRNEEVIERSINRAIELRKKQILGKHEGLRERAVALASFIKYLDRGGSKSVDGYFGRKELARLQGKKVMQILKERKANGQQLWEVINIE